MNEAGYMDLPVVRHKIFSDIPGFAPRDIPTADGPAFKAIRDEYDYPLQVAGATPLQPQADAVNCASYERQLLGDLAKHTKKFHRLDTSTISDELMERYKPQIIQDAMQAPYRENVMREVKTVDRTGREATEYVGPKSSWMNQFKAPGFKVISVKAGPVGSEQEYSMVQGVPLSTPWF